MKALPRIMLTEQGRPRERFLTVHIPVPGRRVQVYGSQETLCGLFGTTDALQRQRLSVAQRHRQDPEVPSSHPACVVLYHQEPES